MMNARGIRSAAVTAGLCLLLVALAGADEVYVTPPDYSGVRSTPPANGLHGEGMWDQTGDNGFQIRWDIVDLGAAQTYRWDYTYTLSGVGGTNLSRGLSHWLLGLSRIYEDDDTDEEKKNQVLAEFPDFTEGQANDTRTYSPSDPGGSNPLLPGDIFAVKFGATGGSGGEEPSTYNFRSTRAPIWGNFYAKDGKNPVTTVWNEGFLSDPAAVTNGDYTNWIATPDSVSSPPQGGPFAEWGDLPDSYQTLAESDGPHHLDGTFERLGKEWDAETDGNPSLNATGDDWTGIDDEDGVEFFDELVCVTITVADRTDTTRYNDDYDAANDLYPHHIYLDGWIDLDQDGTFDEGAADTDHVVNAWHVNPADDKVWDPSSNTVTFCFPVPGWVPGYGPLGTGYYSRWRLSYGTWTTWFGPADFGEVEDYWVAPEPATLSILGVGLVVAYRRRRRR